MKKLLRIDEVKELLPYSDSKIYELIRDGDLKAACPNGIGKKPVFIESESLELYIERILIEPDEWKDPALAKGKRKVINKGV